MLKLIPALATILVYDRNKNIKNRLQISVPGWLVREENVIDETACSELTQVNCRTTD
jgi:hypothetical protein